jgi:hypothetical protein
MWIIERTEEIINWIKKLDEDAKEAVLQHLIILKNIGPSLGRPYVDTIYESKHKNMKELRVQNKQRVYRIFFAFDPERNAILLIGGDKKGNKNFYKEMLPKADYLYDIHLKELEKKHERKK